MGQVVCSPKCSYPYVRKQREKSDAKRERKETREAKQRIKTTATWLKEVQAACNKYIRARDEHKGCVSCEKPPEWHGQWHASHYRPSGNCSPLRFHEMNIHKSCSECNNFKSGNLVEYRATLIRDIGLDNVEWLESQNQPYTWLIDDLKDVKQHYKQKLKDLG